MGIRSHLCTLAVCVDRKTKCCCCCCCCCCWMLLYPYNILLLGPPPSRHTSVFFVLRSKSIVFFSEKVIKTCVFYHAAQSGTFFLEKLETSKNLCVFDICTFCTSLLTSDWLLGLLVPLWGRSRSLLALLAPCWASFLAFLGALLTPLGRLLAPLDRKSVV